MLQSFKAYRVHAENDGVVARFDTVTINEIGTGGVVIRTLFSDINYKDALAVTGKGRIMKRLPLVAGIDVAGTVHSSDDPRFSPGDQVLVVGCGLGEATDGGYAEYARVDGDWVVPLPQGMTLRESMAIGTAGFTAGMAVERMEENGQTPAMGKVLVTGATGGVGGIALSMLSGLGYEVTALTIADESEDYLKQLGAAEVLDARKLEMGTRPLENGLWAGAIDAVGGETLGWITRTIRQHGNIASIGNAGGINFSTTVMPFILRGISLLGINSTYCQVPLREKVWSRLASDLRPKGLDAVASSKVSFDKLPGHFDAMIRGETRGRKVVEF